MASRTGEFSLGQIQAARARHIWSLDEISAVEQGLERNIKLIIHAIRLGDLAILVNPTRVEQVAAVALAGERMPEKSTYFFPKAPTGLVFRPLG